MVLQSPISAVRSYNARNCHHPATATVLQRWHRLHGRCKRIEALQISLVVVLSFFVAFLNGLKSKQVSLLFKPRLFWNATGILLSPVRGRAKPRSGFHATRNDTRGELLGFRFMLDVVLTASLFHSGLDGVWQYRRISRLFLNGSNEMIFDSNPFWDNYVLLFCHGFQQKF